MSTLLVATSPDVPFQKFKTRLDGKDYVLTIDINQRTNRLSLSIADDIEQPILSGLRLITNVPLLQRYRYNALVPPGELMVQTLGSNLEPPGLGELGEGRRAQLIYFDAAVIAAEQVVVRATVTAATPIYIAITITPQAGFVDDATFAAALAANLTRTHHKDTPISVDEIMGATLGLFAYVSAVAFNVSPSPTNTIPLSLLPGTPALFSAANITVTHA